MFNEIVLKYATMCLVIGSFYILEFTHQGVDLW